MEIIGPRLHSKTGRRIFELVDVSHSLEMDKLPLEIIFERHSVAVKKFAGERNLFAERNDLFENCRCYSDAEKGNGVTFMCCGFSITIIWKDQFFIFDSHGRNTTGFHDTNGKVVLVKFSAISSVNNYIKTFYEIIFPSKLSMIYSMLVLK